MESTRSNEREKSNKCCTMLIQLTDRIVVKIRTGYFEKRLFPFADLSWNKPMKNEVQIPIAVGQQRLFVDKTLMDYLMTRSTK